MRGISRTFGAGDPRRDKTRRFIRSAGSFFEEKIKFNISPIGKVLKWIYLSSTTFFNMSIPSVLNLTKYTPPGNLRLNWSVPSQLICIAHGAWGIA